MSKGWDNCYSVSKLESYFHQVGTWNRSFAFGDQEYYMPLKNENDFLIAFNSCPPLKAIISKRAKAFNVGKIEILNKNTGNFARGSEANGIKDKLNRPNAIQTGKQFFSQQNHYIDIFGYCPVIIIRPAGMVDEISSIWNVPPWLFDIEYTGKWINQQKVSDIYKTFYMYWGGQKIELEYKNLWFIFDDGIGTETDTNLTIPDSRLISLDYPVSNTIAAYKSRNTLITKRGAIGILSNDAKDQSGVIPLQASKKEDIQKDFKNYGIAGQPYQVIITEASLKWQQMGFPTKELMLFEEIEDDINRICDEYGYPSELMSRGKDVTFDNKKEAKKMLYADTIIPESESRMEQFSNAILGRESNIKILRDFLDVDVLQEDKKSQAEARKSMNEALKIEYDNGLITKNDWLEAMGYDRRTDPTFDEYKNETAPENTGTEAEEQAS